MLSAPFGRGGSARRVASRPTRLGIASASCHNHCSHRCRSGSPRRCSGLVPSTCRCNRPRTPGSRSRCPRRTAPSNHRRGSSYGRSPRRRSSSSNCLRGTEAGTRSRHRSSCCSCLGDNRRRSCWPHRTRSFRRCRARGSGREAACRSPPCRRRRQYPQCRRRRHHRRPRCPRRRHCPHRRCPAAPGAHPAGGPWAEAALPARGRRHRSGVRHRASRKWSHPSCRCPRRDRRRSLDPAPRPRLTPPCPGVSSDCSRRSSRRSRSAHWPPSTSASHCQCSAPRAGRELWARIRVAA